MKAFNLALRSLRRDWRSTELRILVLALIVAVGAVTAVGFFTNRIERLIEIQATELLAADLRISSAEPLPSAFLNEAHRNGLRTALMWEFPSVIWHNDDTTLVYVKAVSENYPLRGQLRVADESYGAQTQTTAIPTAGNLWLEERLFTQLGLQVGDHLNLGEMRFTIAKVLTYEPDRGGLFFQFAPRVLMNLDDIDKTQLIGVGSRVRYRLLVAGALDKMADYRAWLEQQVEPGQQIQGIEESRPELRQALERTEQFLGLAALIAVILAGAAIAVAAQHFSQRQADASAIMRCLGATQKLIGQIYLLRLLGLGLLGSGIGCALGWLAQLGLSTLLANYLLTSALPPPSLLPILVGMATGLITLLGFALLPVLRIHRVPPLRVLRHELGAPPPAVWQLVGVATVAMVLLMFWQAKDSELALFMIGGTFLTLLVFIGVAYGLVLSLRFFRQLGTQTDRLPSFLSRFFRLSPQAGVTWRFGLANLARRAKSSSVQLAAFGLGIMALLLLAVVRVDLLDTWQNLLPEGTPNYFIINIQEDEVESLQTLLSAPQYNNSGLYPMSVGRFIAINEQPVLAKNYTSPRAKRFAERSFNLSSADTLPDGNQMIAGHFFDNAPGQLSVEEGFAKEMGIQLGDILHFQIAGQAVSGKVTSLRSVQWDTFRVNFFVLASPELMRELPKTYVTSFYLPPHLEPIVKDEITNSPSNTSPVADSELKKNHFVVSMVREFPGITVINVEALLAQVRLMINRATLAVHYVFLFTLLAGIMVLYAAISASFDERLYEGALLRALGATRRQVLLGLMTEFTILGLLAGLLAATAASGLGYVLAVQVFNLPYHLNGWLWVIGPLGGALGVCLAGVLGTRSLLQQPPLEILRRN